MTDSNIPIWDLGNVYPSLDSQELVSSINFVDEKIDFLDKYLSSHISVENLNLSKQEIANIIGESLDQFNLIYKSAGTIRAYLSSFISTDSRNKIAMKKMSEFEQIILKIQMLITKFHAWIGKNSEELDEIIPLNKTALTHKFAVMEAGSQSRYLMSELEENLASDLEISGAGAWGKLQNTLTSQLTVEFELNGKLAKMPMPALINLHSSPDENVRKRAYEAERTAWKTIEEPLAAAINGIKGADISLNKRRNRVDCLHTSIDMSRIERETLEVMLEAMRGSFPSFHKYFQSKALKLGKNKLAWWDVFAPVGNMNKIYSWSEAKTVILDNFFTFSPQLADFAKKAFDHSWIDSRQRDGKSGGAFCMGIPLVKESRILCNFDGTLDQVSTIAHELGHAFHNDCAFKAGKTEIQQDTPMTLAETASIMCETIVLDAVISQTNNIQEKMAILDTRLIGDAQVIIDIYSRYLFEKEVFERREKSELSADELCEIMEDSQRQTYGAGIDEKFLMKYMWTWKPHYYRPGFSFYNYPYTFGLLFSTGLFAIYQERGPEFVPEYINLLASTGEANAADLANRFGININDIAFWKNSLKIITKNIDEYERI